MKNLLFLLIICLNVPGFAQRNLTLPEASQAAEVMQQIGLTKIRISYHSPLVNDRVVWGGIVPYNEVWRAGANENTVVEFTSDVLVEGKQIRAGNYGLHMIPSKDQWTLIFSKDSKSWGSFFYDEKNDALRVMVQPKTVGMQNWLSYSFRKVGADSVQVVMHWEKIEITFNIRVNVPEVVVQNMREELKNIPGFFPEAYQQAAAYCVNRKVYLADAEMWIDKSISLQKGFANMNTKSQLLELQGKTKEAKETRDEAMKLADEQQLNTYGYELIAQGNMEGAIRIFNENVKRYPDSWNVYDSLAEAYERSGENKSALEYYRKALAKAPEAQHKRLKGTIEKLSALN
jgi:hypothetical protein